MVSVSAMVHKFKDTKLSSVALKSDKVRSTVCFVFLCLCLCVCVGVSKPCFALPCVVCFMCLFV